MGKLEESLMDKLRIYKEFLIHNLEEERKEFVRIELSESEIDKGIVGRTNRLKFNQGHLKLTESQEKLYELFPKLENYKNE